MGQRDQIVRNIWEVVRRDQETILRGGGTVNLYSVQVLTNLVFDYAYQRQDIEILDQLAQLFLVPLDRLETFNDYWFYISDSSNPHAGYISLPLPAPSMMWVDKEEKGIEIIPVETVLHSSQFLYLISHAIHSFVSLDKQKRTDNMTRVIVEYTPVVLDHYRRWIFYSNGSTELHQSIGVFQVKAWGCSNGRFNHREFLEKKLHRKFGDLNPRSFCNVVTDLDMWILGGAIEMLAAREKDPGLFSLEDEQKNEYLEYFSIGCRLIKDRLVRTDLRNFNDEPVYGYSFDPGIWRDHPDMRYAGYDGTLFPEDNRTTPPAIIINPADFPLPADLSWDINHARRFVPVFETLHRNRSTTRQIFPTREILQGLASQAAYAVFNSDFEKPLFVNFFNGSNGWYRVNYSHRDRFGYQPWDLSIEWIRGGYIFWKAYQPDLEKIWDALWKMIDSTDADIIDFRKKHYEEPYYQGGKRVQVDCFNLNTSPYMLNFITAHDSQPGPDEAPPVFTLDRTRLNFGARIKVPSPYTQYTQKITIDNTGKLVLSWKAVSSADWLKTSHTSGTDSGEITVWVEHGGLLPGIYHGSLELSSPEAVNSPQIIPVSMRIYPKNKKIKPLGVVELPVENALISGAVAITGWALDEIGMESVKIYREPPPGQRNPVYIGDAVFVENVRPDVETAYPDYPFNYRAGWGYMLLTNNLPGNGNGTFKLHVKAKNTSGQEVTLGIKTITCDNANSRKPFGTIDEPAPCKIISGRNYSISGWVLTPQPNKIPIDGSTIKIIIDNRHIGNAVYNIHRADIERVFPGYANSKGAHGYFDFDTTAFANGRHTLSWLVTDSAGNVEGIGSRHFFIKN
jgi:hypothetical protein